MEDHVKIVWFYVNYLLQFYFLKLILNCHLYNYNRKTVEPPTHYKHVWELDIDMLLKGIVSANIVYVRKWCISVFAKVSLFKI